MTVRRLRRVWRGARRLKNRFKPRVLILLYHRVTTLASDPWRLSVSPQHFAEHLEVLQKRAQPVRLQQLAGALEQGNLPNRSVVITLDDGYADNLYNAKVALRRYDVPATVFLTTDTLEHEREFWWDELDRILLQPGRLPEVLRLSVNGKKCRWDLGEAANYGEDAFRRYRRWKAWEEGPTSRHSLYSSLWELLHPLAEGERRRIMDELLGWAGMEPAGRPTHRSLSLEEMLALAEEELIEIGAHTKTHPSLSALPIDSQYEEIWGSKKRLQELLDRPVRSFAYPYGRLSDYGEETIAIVQQAGFSCSCSNFAGLIDQTTHPFQLPRVQVRDWDRDAFEERLSWWFDG